MTTSATIYSFDGIDTLEVTSDAAGITIGVAPEGTSTTVSLADRNGNALPEELLEIAQDGAALLVTVRAMRAGRWKRNRTIDARLLVSAPAAVAAHVHADAGSVRVLDREADVTIVAHVGSIAVERVRGGIDIRSSAGSVKLAESIGSAVISSDAGSVTVDRHQGEQLELRTSAGSVKATALEVARIAATTDAGAIRLAFATPPVSVEASCSVGAVNVELPDAEYEITQLVSGLGRSRMNGIASVPGAERTVHLSTSGVGSLTVSAAKQPARA